MCGQQLSDPLPDTDPAEQAKPSASRSTRCSRCVLPGDIPMLDLSSDGVCSVCTRQAAADAAAGGNADGEGASLEEIIEDTRRRGRESEFDCVIGLSGGRDSSYLAYLLRKKHGLRVLAVYYRTVFTPEVTDQNVRRISSLLDIPLVEVDSIPWEYHRRVARR